MAIVLTAAQMRAAEQAAMAQGDVTGLDLMERAGAGVVAACLAHWPELRGQTATTGGQPPDPRDISTPTMNRRAVVLCGPGNNGGDGYVVARLLRQAGWQVVVLAAGAPATADAAVNAARWQDLGDIADLDVAALQDLGRADLYVDALVGTGLSRRLEGALAAVVAEPADMDVARLVAVAVPLAAIIGVVARYGIARYQDSLLFQGQSKDL